MFRCCSFFAFANYVVLTAIVISSFIHLLNVIIRIQAINTRNEVNLINFSNFITFKNLLKYTLIFSMPVSYLLEDSFLKLCYACKLPFL